MFFFLIDNLFLMITYLRLIDMSKMNNKIEKIKIPDGFVVFISGVPGVGKTTISYELLKECMEFRIVQETDLIREVLRGYNDYLTEKFQNNLNFILDGIEITDYTKLLNYGEAMQQCTIMKKSFENIVFRQQRKGVSSIINGVHIIPEVMNGIAGNNNIIYINLYINNEKELYNRLLSRNPMSYMLNHVPLIFQTNVDLDKSVRKLSQKEVYVFHSIDVTSLSPEETIAEIMHCIDLRVKNINGF